MTVTIPKQVRALLTTVPPAFTPTEVEKLALEQYGIRSKCHLLASERDQNFRLDADNGNQYTFKISNHAEEASVVDFQNHALQHIATHDPEIPIPRVIVNLGDKGYGLTESSGKAHMIRLFSWMHGQVLYESKAQAALLQQMGALLARLGLALSNFDHPGSNPALLWDMKRAGNLRALLPCIEDPALHSMIDYSLDRFDKIAPEMMQLRQQVIYNDLNPDNVLIEHSPKTDIKQSISGIIDFGDLVKSPLIIDVAVAAAYYLSDGNDPLASALPLISGYHHQRPLLEKEIQILPDLIRTRLITSLLIMSWRMAEFPDNREYLQRSQASSKAFLASLNKFDDSTAIAQIKSACPSNMTP